MSYSAGETADPVDETPSEKSTAATSSVTRSYEVVIMGGGEAGLTVAKSLLDSDANIRIALIEPVSYKYDQPRWVQVGTEGLREEATRSPEKLHVPSGVDWIQDWVSSIDGERRVLGVEEGAPVRYDYLVVATGIGPCWDRIRGLKEGVGTRGICSVYDYEQAPRAWEMIRGFEGGRAVFTAPYGPYKGGNTPLNVLRRAETLWREAGVWERTELLFATTASPEYANEEYAEILEREDTKNNVQIYLGHELIEVRPERYEAVFTVRKGNSESRNVLEYDLIHVVPPMRPPTVIEQSELSYQGGSMRGYLRVDPESYRHPQFDTVFGAGDVVGLESVKTGEEARKQAAQVAETLRRILEQHK